MRKTITISGVPCEFKSSAAIPRMYRLKFNRDIFTDMTRLKKQIDAQNRLKDDLKKQAEEKGEEFNESDFESGLPIESLEMFENIAYLMHKHGDPSQPSDIDEWLDQFDETFSIYQYCLKFLKCGELKTSRSLRQKKRQRNRP